MSLAVTIVNSSQGMSPAKEIFLMRPRGTELRTVTPCSIPGKLRSSTYSAWPVTFFRPSLRGIGLPTRVISSVGLNRGDDNKVGSSGRIGVFQLAGDIQDLDANERFVFVIIDHRVIQLRLAVRWMGVRLERNIKRVDIVLIIKAEWSNRQFDPHRG